MLFVSFSVERYHPIQRILSSPTSGAAFQVIPGDGIHHSRDWLRHRSDHIPESSELLRGYSSYRISFHFNDA